MNNDTGPVRPTVDVPTVGLSSYDRLYLFVLVIGAAFGYPLVAFAVDKNVLVPLTARLLIWTIVLAAIFLFLENSQGSRGMRIGDSGVTFRYILHKERWAWSTIELPPAPQPYAKQRRGVFVSRRLPGEADNESRTLFVTRDQARVILSDPRCVMKDIDPQVRSYLGL